MKKNDFMGRATRGEWWVLSILFSVFQFILRFGPIAPIPIASSLALIVPIVPILSLVLVILQLAVSVRRMHDLDKSGWWILVPVYGWILCAFVGGTSGKNRFGSGFTRLGKLCRQCGKIYPYAMKVCPQCGSSLYEETRVSTEKSAEPRVSDETS